MEKTIQQKQSDASNSEAVLSMIEPAEKDIGREVLYTGTRWRDQTAKIGVVTGFDLHCVYVRYGVHTTSEGNRRQDLEWVKQQLVAN